MITKAVVSPKEVNLDEDHRLYRVFTLTHTFAAQKKKLAI
jgi:hypothetical protein